MIIQKKDKKCIQTIKTDDDIQCRGLWLQSLDIVQTSEGKWDKWGA